MQFVRTDPARHNGRSFVPVAPDHSPTDASGIVWTAAPRSRVAYAIGPDDLRYRIGDRTFATFADAVAWVVSR